MDTSEMKNIWNQEKKAINDAYAKIDLAQVRNRLNAFDADAYKLAISEYVASRGMIFHWVDETYSGGFHYNINIRNQDVFGIDRDLISVQTLIDSMLEKNVDKDSITGKMHTSDEVRGSCDQMLYYIF